MFHQENMTNKEKAELKNENAPKKEDDSKKEDTPKSEDNPKNEDNQNNEDDHKNEDDSKNEDGNFFSEDTLQNIQLCYMLHEFGLYGKNKLQFFCGDAFPSIGSEVQRQSFVDLKNLDSYLAAVKKVEQKQWWKFIVSIWFHWSASKLIYIIPQCGKSELISILISRSVHLIEKFLVFANNRDECANIATHFIRLF